MSFTTHDRSDILKLLLNEKPPPFALLHRPEASGKENIDVMIGDASVVDSLDEIDLPDKEQRSGEALHDMLVLLPYRQISQRGFEATDDGTPLVVMDIRRQEVWKVEEVMAGIPDTQLELADTEFSMDDDAYKAIVREVLDKEIGRGKGASFVLQRSFTANITNYSVIDALGIFKKLLTQETGAYWTFIVHTGERTLLGATPEQHINLNKGTVKMNPISGTYRYPRGGPKLSEITKFLSDKKEANELYMVVDEELKMMASICNTGGTLDGPRLKEMSSVAHTEYFIRGQSSMGPLKILKETMFAPSVMGSPLESAARVIRQYEPEGRGYYSGVVALIGRENGQSMLDSGILIRTADIDNSGHLRISVGATLVRGSNPSAEMEETRAKASGILAAFGGPSDKGFSRHPEVVRLLEERNQSIAEFWQKDRSAVSSSESILSGKKVLIVDEEDTFTLMIEHQLRSLGCETLVRRFDEPYSFDDGYDLVVMGPGPGDPRNMEDPKIAHLCRDIEEILARQLPFLSVCLSHQVLAAILGLDLVRRDDPNQGVQKEIDLFGKRERVGFYNTFSARCAHDRLTLPRGRGIAELSRDSVTGEVHAIRGAGFCGVQFHPESILTIDGVRIFREILTSLFRSNVESRRPLDLERLSFRDNWSLESPWLPVARQSAEGVSTADPFVEKLSRSDISVNQKVD